MIKKYENLALQGGGVWGITYAGAFEELDRLGILGEIKCVAGTSAGSLLGLLLALRYSAVRASMSVPLFFTAFEINRQIFVDGGAVFDYPLMGFGKDEIEHSLGLAFAQSSVVATIDQDDRKFGYHQPLQYIQRMVNVLERVQSPVFALHDELQENTILIDTAGVAPLNFKLSEAEKDLLIANGQKAVRDFFN